tara:strand:+ start:305 stop:643 length:339 start_codon:yes stop_codon:yes gene_type:complete
MLKKIEQIVKDIDKTNDQRRKWLIASSVVAISIIVYISGWHWIRGQDDPWLKWSIVSVGLIVSVNWWYWTMSIVRQYIMHQHTIVTTLVSIINDLKIIKEEVKSLNSVDNDN